jgi:alanine dehydrogenase
MLIGIPKEVKNHEYRVSVSPQGVRELVHHGHQILVQKNAGANLGFDDADYVDAGALIVDTPEEVYERAEMIVKVKEPQASEYRLIREGQILFCYLHLAAEPKMATALMESGCIAISYETVTADDGSLPLLAPMSEVAGRVAIQAGAHCLEAPKGGRGVLIGGVPGVLRGNVTIVGGGVVGTNAAMMAAGMGGNVTILDRSVKRLRQLEEYFGTRANCLYSTVDAIEQYVTQADLVVGAVLIPGAAAPKVISESLVKKMRKGSVFVDVAIDQGGSSETSRPTTHDDPTYVVDDVVHYCVTNMPSAVARTSTIALENSTLPYILSLADNGYRTALRDDLHFRNGLNVYRGRITHEAVAGNLNHAYVPPSTFLGTD